MLGKPTRRKEGFPLTSKRPADIGMTSEPIGPRLVVESSAYSSNRNAGANLGVRDAEPMGAVVALDAGGDRLDISPDVYGGVGMAVGGESL